MYMTRRLVYDSEAWISHPRGRRHHADRRSSRPSDPSPIPPPSSFGLGTARIQMLCCEVYVERSAGDVNVILVKGLSSKATPEPILQDVPGAVSLIIIVYTVKLT